MEYFKLKTTATAITTRNEKKRLRIKEINVVFEPLFEENPDFPIEEFKKKLERCSKISEDYCVVTQSVREGIAVSTEFRI